MVKVILDVPKIKQLKRYCFPASLAMVCQFYGYSNTQEKIGEWFGYDVRLNTVALEDMIPSIRAHGLIAHPRQRVGLEGIMRSIDKGVPLITIVRSRIFNVNSLGLHAVVVRGYETNPNVVWFNDPSVLSRDRILYDNFNKEWKNIRTYRGYFNQYGISIRDSE